MPRNPICALVITPATALKPPSAAGRTPLVEVVAVVAVAAASDRRVTRTTACGHVSKRVQAIASQRAVLVISSSVQRLAAPDAGVSPGD